MCVGFLECHQSIWPWPNTFHMRVYTVIQIKQNPNSSSHRARAPKLIIPLSRMLKVTYTWHIRIKPDISFYRNHHTYYSRSNMSRHTNARATTHTYGYIENLSMRCARARNAIDDAPPMFLGVLVSPLTHTHMHTLRRTHSISPVLIYPEFLCQQDNVTYQFYWYDARRWSLSLSLSTVSSAVPCLCVHTKLHVWPQRTAKMFVCLSVHVFASQL